jgi:hypothetical protein
MHFNSSRANELLVILLLPVVLLTPFRHPMAHASHPSPGTLYLDVALRSDDLLFGLKRDQYCKIDLSDLNARVQSFNGYGLTRVKNDPEIVISFTSFPARILDVTSCLYSLFTQTYRPDRVVLFLSRAEFRNTSLPVRLLEWQQYGLTIHWVDEDIKEYLKILPALRLFPTSVIITVDDDAFYPSYLIERLVASYKKNPKVVHAHRTSLVRISGENMSHSGFGGRDSGSHARFPKPNQLLVAEGIGGVLFPPDIFPNEVFNSSAFFRLCPWHDDIWLFAMRALRGVPVQIPENEDSRHCGIPRNSQIPAPGLAYWNWALQKNDEQVSAVARAYDLANILRNIVGSSESYNDREKWTLLILLL